MKVDFHIHSLHSDGVYTVEQVVEILMQNNIQMFALTDHDTVDGVKQAKRLSKGKIKCISGIEFTCKEIPIETLQKSFSIHLLGYGFDEESPNLKKALQSRKENAESVYCELCKELTALGYAVQVEEIPISCGNVLQLCDVTGYIQKQYSCVSNNAFEKINAYAPKLDSVNLSAEQAVGLIHDAGGKAIWAHPFCVYHNFEKQSLSQKEVTETLETLQKIGIDGLEAFYRSFEKEKQDWLFQMANSKKMIYTAGSDFHGSKGRDAMGVSISL